MSFTFTNFRINDPDEGLLIAVDAYCGGYLACKSLIDEPDECCWGGTVYLSEQDWNEGNAGMECPQCGAWLDQSDNHFEIAKRQQK